MTDIAEGFDLVKSISIDNLLRQRDAMHERLHTVRVTLSEIADIGKSAGIFDTESYHRSLDRAIYGEGSRYAYRTELQTAESIDAACKRIDAMAWDLLMRESGLWSLMDAKAREEWRENIDKVKVPPLTRENIEATFQSLYGARADMFERGVLLCFRGPVMELQNQPPTEVRQANRQACPPLRQRRSGVHGRARRPAARLLHP